MPTLLITGASRGLGLGLLKLYAADGWRVLACCRDPGRAPALADVVAGAAGRVSMHTVDLENLESVDALGQSLRGIAIDVLVNMAGFYGSKIMTEPGGQQRFGESDFVEWQTMYRVNVMAPMRMCEVLIDNVDAGGRKVIVNISSIAGSIGTIRPSAFGGNLYGYRASKAALNMISRAMAEDLRARGIIVVPLHPGWVRTAMGGPTADLGTDESAAGMKKVIDGLTMADTGKYLTYNGGALPW